MQASWPFRMLDGNRASAVFVAIILTAATVTLVWNSRSRYHEYLAHQELMAERAVGAVASELALQVAELRNRVRLFAEENGDLLEAVTASPEAAHAYDSLTAKLDRHFPDRFAFAVAGNDGTTLADDFDNLVGELCRSDIRAFAGSEHLSKVYIHPQPEAYHFDIMARWSDQSGHPRGVFFVSFHPNLISRILGNGEPAGHRLLLLLRGSGGLIEVSAEGARDVLPRDGFRLAPADMERIAASRAVAGTEWLLADLPDPDLYVREQRLIWRETGAFVVFVVLVSLVMLRFLDRSERRRFAAEAGLRRAQHELELRVRDRTQRLSHANEELQKQVRERKSVEVAMREGKAILNAILETAVDAIIVVDDLGTVQRFNSSAERIFGYRAAEVLGQNIKMLMPPPYRDEHDGYLANYHATGERKIIGKGRQVEGLRKDGTVFPMDLAVSEVDLGKRKLFAGIVRDLSAS